MFWGIKPSRKVRLGELVVHIGHERVQAPFWSRLVTKRTRYDAMSLPPQTLNKSDEWNWKTKNVDVIG
jgi:hypothetical protein